MDLGIEGSSYRDESGRETVMIWMLYVSVGVWGTGYVFVSIQIVCLQFVHFVDYKGFLMFVCF